MARRSRTRTRRPRRGAADNRPVLTSGQKPPSLPARGTAHAALRCAAQQNHHRLAQHTDKKRGPECFAAKRRALILVKQIENGMTHGHHKLESGVGSVSPVYCETVSNSSLPSIEYWLISQTKCLLRSTRRCAGVSSSQSTPASLYSGYGRRLSSIATALRSRF